MNIGKIKRVIKNVPRPVIVRNWPSKKTVKPPVLVPTKVPARKD